MTKVLLFTDGACSGNPGPGGWGSILMSGRHIRKLSGFEPSTTNNRMELMAVIAGLRALKSPSTVEVTTDSQYVKKAFTDGWLENWQRNGWRTASKEPVKNMDLWLLLCELQRIHVLTWKWVRGHNGHAQNEECDALARAAIVRKAGIDERSVEE